MCFHHHVSWHSFRVKCRKSSLLPSHSPWVCHCMDSSYFRQTITDRQAGRFQLEAITHNSALNHLAHVSFCTCEHMSEVGWLDERVCAFVSLINIAKLPFLEVIPSGAWGCLSLCSLSAQPSSGFYFSEFFLLFLLVFLSTWTWESVFIPLKSHVEIFIGITFKV